MSVKEVLCPPLSEEVSQSTECSIKTRSQFTSTEIPEKHTAHDVSSVGLLDNHDDPQQNAQFLYILFFCKMSGNDE